VFDAIGRGATVVGAEPWQANVAKIAANFMLASLLETMGEAMALVRKSAIDPHTFLEMLNGIFNSPVYANYGRIIVEGAVAPADRAFKPAGFRLALGLKDVGLALAAGQDARVPLPIASVLRDQFLTAMAAGLQDADWAAVSEVAARNAGIEAK
jgi:3-hydroxyisobutyrate dehydrogenase-like beta-hydroxyacid dehydrogenase